MGHKLNGGKGLRRIMIWLKFFILSNIRISQEGEVLMCWKKSRIQKAYAAMYLH